MAVKRVGPDRRLLVCNQREKTPCFQSSENLFSVSPAQIEIDLPISEAVTSKELRIDSLVSLDSAAQVQKWMLIKVYEQALLGKTKSLPVSLYFTTKRVLSFLTHRQCWSLLLLVVVLGTGTQGLLHPKQASLSWASALARPCCFSSKWQLTVA